MLKLLVVGVNGVGLWLYKTRGERKWVRLGELVSLLLGFEEVADRDNEWVGRPAEKRERERDGALVNQTRD